MKIYLVGGAVRDELLGLPIKERDWVVVGATPSEMLQLGYRQVGKDFPVFLHPRTHEEYALARMERKVAPGYQGFVFDTAPTVTLAEDLQRRDLTINAMAKSDHGEIIDPYHGQADLKAGLLRHVSPAFGEDPVRILRVGRFLARYANLGFTVAPKTMALMQAMVTAGEVNALVAERVWKELERALSEPYPEKFFDVLIQSGAFAILFPDWHANSIGMQALRCAASLNYPTIVRFAALCHDVPDSIAKLANRYRIPRHYRDLAMLTARHADNVINASQLSADHLLKLLMSLDIFRRQERFDHFLQAVTAIVKARENKIFDLSWLIQCATLVKAYDVQLLLQQGLSGQALAEALYQARKNIIQGYMR